MEKINYKVRKFLTRKEIKRFNKIYCTKKAIRIYNKIQKQILKDYGEKKEDYIFFRDVYLKKLASNYFFCWGNSLDTRAQELIITILKKRMLLFEVESKIKYRPSVLIQPKEEPKDNLNQMLYSRLVEKELFEDLAELYFKGNYYKYDYLPRYFHRLTKELNKEEAD